MVHSAVLATVAFGLFCSAPAAAQTLHDAVGAPDALKLSASVRIRYETIENQVRPGFAKNEDLVSIRTTLLAEYTKGPIRIGTEIYDSRAYDADPGSVIGTGEVNTFEPVQAYLAADLVGPFGRGSSATVQAGRFTLNLGSRRLVAADEYRNTTNGYTGIRADLRTSSALSATLIYVLPQTRLPDTLPDIVENRARLDREEFATRLWGGLVTRPHAFGRTDAELGYFDFGERDAPGRPTRNRSLHNIDARIIRDPAPGAWDYEVEGIYQFGSIRTSNAPTAPEVGVSAGFAHVEAGYSFSGGWQPHVSFEADYASGDGPGGRYGRFDTLYGMRRADLGPAGLYNAIGRANIATIGVRAEVRPGRNTDAFLSYRSMWLASASDSFSTTGVRDPSGASGSFAGNQVEGRLRQWIVPKLLRAEVNGVWLAKGGVLRDAPNAQRTGDTLYASLAITANF